MAPLNQHIPTQLRQLIYYNLDNNQLHNATFIAARLHAYDPRSPEAAYLLAQCHLQSGQSKAALDYSRSAGSRGTHLGCSFVYAQACMDLGKYLEGVTALERAKIHWAGKSNWNKHNETRRQPLPDAPAVLCLQGKLWQAHKDLNKAVECYVQALKLNPFMWDAFMGLCSTGVNVQIPNIYKLTPDMMAALSPTLPEPSIETSDKPRSTNVMPEPGRRTQATSRHQHADPFVSTRSDAGNLGTYGSSALWEKLNGSSNSVASDGMETPVGRGGSEDNHRQTATEQTWNEPPLAPARKTRLAQAMDYGNEAPPRIRSGLTRTRMKTKVESEDANIFNSEKDAHALPTVSDRKRNIAGQVAHSTSTQQGDQDAPAIQRRSIRLFNQLKPPSSRIGTSSGSLLRESREVKKAKATGTRGRSTASTSTVGRVVSGNRKIMPEGMDVDGKETKTATTSGLTAALAAQAAQHTAAQARQAANERAKEMEALNWILEVFSVLAQGYFLISRYQGEEAIRKFNSLDQSQRETPWVLAQIGRAHYELTRYSEAERYLMRAKTLAPSRLEDMEVYSTVLWHLKNEVELAYMAHELMEVDRLSPQAWCTLGNSCSLAQDHDKALKCFKRATQLDPTFAYAFTLQGHEHVANEEYDKALDAYRNGIGADHRHYNAWYGLGKVYEKLGKYETAEQHYRMAASINPSNSVLLCCIGMVLEKMKNPHAALMQYSDACELAPRSAMARYKKARVLMGLGKPNEALVELKILKDIAPDEANVHFLLGKLYKMVGDKPNAIKHFTTSLNLDPKAAQYIKDAMESLDDDEEIDEDEDDDM